MSKKEKIELVVKIVAAYVVGNKLPSRELPRLCQRIYEVLSELEGSTEIGEGESPRPAVEITKSVTRDGILCLEDGKKFKLLKRHLHTAHGLSPEEYRAKWGLEARYPMVAPAYSKRRSEVALEFGLGRSRRSRSASRKTVGKQQMDAA